MLGIRNSLYYGLLILTVSVILSGCNKKPVLLRLDVTTDVHGMIFPYDQINNRQTDHSLAQVYAYVQEKRTEPDTAVVLLDNGDILQGQPVVYYFNTMKRDTVHLAAQVMNFMGYEAGTIGNHDIEAGPAVYNKIKNEFGFPWLAANVIDSATGTPAFQPYTIIKQGPYKIAVLGLTTPGVHEWLPRSLWPGLEFRDMIKTAEEWVPLIRKKEKPDLMIGLFHSGTDYTYGHQSADVPLNQNATLLVAQQVPGFDIIFAGHDHETSIQWIVNSENDSVLVVDPGSHATVIGEVIVGLSHKNTGKKIRDVRLVPVKDYEPSSAFMEKFTPQLDEVKKYLSDTITFLDKELRSIDGLFGPSAFIGLIQNIQTGLSGATISFASPLTFNSVLEKGPVLVSDMFKLYRFENMLYRMKLTGYEIDNYLEYSVSLWFNQMKNPDDHLLLFSPDNPGRLKNQYYNFSSASGINYTVDLQRPDGNRVNIICLAGGKPFTPADTFLVAVNSYRGNGGGGHLTTGAGIPSGELTSRIDWSTTLDLRYYMMQYMSAFDTLSPVVPDNWTLIPVSWAYKATVRDKKLLTGK